MVRLEDYVIGGTGAVKELDGWRLVALDEAGIYGDVDPYSKAGTAAFKAWCAKNSVYYYGRPRESFFNWEAIDLAEKANASYVIMEDMS